MSALPHVLIGPHHCRCPVERRQRSCHLVQQCGSHHCGENTSSVQVLCPCQSCVGVGERGKDGERRNLKKTHSPTAHYTPTPSNAFPSWYRTPFLPYRPAAETTHTTTLDLYAHHKHHLPSPKPLLSLGRPALCWLAYDGAACAGQVGHGQLRSLHSALQLFLVLSVHGCSPRSHSLYGRTRQAAEREGEHISVWPQKDYSLRTTSRRDSLVSVHAGREGEPLDYEFLPK